MFSESKRGPSVRHNNYIIGCCMLHQQNSVHCTKVHIIHLTTIVQDAGVTILGTVPSLVKTWKSTQCMEGLDWTKIK